MPTLVKKAAILCHRWMGVAFCLLFAWWFVSGIFMMYWDYPAVSDADRLEHAPFLDGSKVKLSAEEAWAKVDDSDQVPRSVRLAVFEGRPAYEFQYGFDSAHTVYADTGEQQIFFTPGMRLRTAAEWTGQPASEARVELIEEPDQWTLEGGLRRLFPLHKYSWPNGEQVYVDHANQVVQFTTRSSRLFAYLGPIPHWLYYTPLRRNGPLWSKVVIWLSGIATMAALMGLIVGLMMYSPSRKISIPYTGQKRLHHILGLFFGTVACTWAFSGMLSMEPFPLSSGRPQQGRSIAAGLRGKRPQLSQYSKPPQEVLAQLGPAFPVKQLELSSFASDPMYVATGAHGETRIVRMLGEPLVSFNTGRILNVLNTVTHVAEARLITQYDAYYLDRTGQRPLPVLFVQLNDDAGSQYYIDPKTAQVVGAYRSSTESWVNRWLYHGLHSINFPWLYNYRPAWDIVVLTLMLGGTSLCVTSVIIGFQLVRRKLFIRRATGASL